MRRTRRSSRRRSNALMAGRTTLIFAHRLSSVIGADRILVLDGGRVAESGRHAELMRRQGVYFHLMRGQAEESRGPGDVELADPAGRPPAEDLAPPVRGGRAGQRDHPRGGPRVARGVPRALSPRSLVARSAHPHVRVRDRPGGLPHRGRGPERARGGRRQARRRLHPVAVRPVRGGPRGRDPALGRVVDRPRHGVPDAHPDAYRPLPQDRRPRSRVAAPPALGRPRGDGEPTTWSWWSTSSPTPSLPAWWRCSFPRPSSRSCSGSAARSPRSSFPSSRWWRSPPFSPGTGWTCSVRAPAKRSPTSMPTRWTPSKGLGEIIAFERTPERRREFLALARRQRRAPSPVLPQPHPAERGARNGHRARWSGGGWWPAPGSCPSVASTRPSSPCWPSSRWPRSCPCPRSRTSGGSSPIRWARRGACTRCTGSR